MNAPVKHLADDASRRKAITVHDRSYLVEAGAGSGKTAVLAGRIAMMLAGGIEPKRIAAVTFTELAASELLIRIREFVSELSSRRIPLELRIALPDGISKSQHENLRAVSTTIDELTCTTIHGFCQRLIKPYPVEADIDPGATIMDSDQADLVFNDIIKAWLVEQLDQDVDSLLAEMVLQDPDQTLRLVDETLGQLRHVRTVTVASSADIEPSADEFVTAVEGFSGFMETAGVMEDQTAEIAERFHDLAQSVRNLSPAEAHRDLCRLLLLRPGPVLHTQSGNFRAYRKKGKWAAAAGHSGLAKADGEQLNISATGHYERCRDTWQTLMAAAAQQALSDLLESLRPAAERFREYKRSAALLDFEDLIFAARALLRDHDSIRCALAARFTHVLVDEFQDTDPLQTEIFWRLCGDPPEPNGNSDWTSYGIRPGALFLVGDPKQAIYRFRGADVAAYMRARDALRALDPQSILSISTNFRSREPILRYVNERFETPLSTDNGQPGFTALDSFAAGGNPGLCVAALNIPVADEDGKASAPQQRDGEAESVADMCARLIGSDTIRDRKTGEPRTCLPGDIALLAPTSTDLWRYEEALERRGIPVATQAGKGLYRRQEIHDLIALTRTLADHRDTLALGALLRGPLVGLTEEELLDIVWALPRPEGSDDTLPRLNLLVRPEHLQHEHARKVVEKLQALRRRFLATTPYDLLAQAVDVLRVRPILLQRHRGQAERALANVDLYLSFSRNYAVRGLRAFAEAMTAAWTDASKAIEGRPDAQEEAVALYTMHAAKGLEWPIVMPVNTMTAIRHPGATVIDRGSGRIHCPVFGVKPTGYDAAYDAEKEELDRERIRLWYVATTRARELLVLPRLDVDAKASSWMSLVDLSIPELTSLDLGGLSTVVGEEAHRVENTQTRAVFAAEAAEIAERHRNILWRIPSRNEGEPGSSHHHEAPEDYPMYADGAEATHAKNEIRGGLERGRILHKLIEEVLTEETPETEAALVTRAQALIHMAGHPIAEDPAKGLAPDELAACVQRALSIPEIASLRPGLLPEFPVYASTLTEEGESVVSGIADAIAFSPSGFPDVVVDWKTDVAPTRKTLDHYRAQVREYLDVTEARRGLIVLVTSGSVVPVTGSPPD